MKSNCTSQEYLHFDKNLIFVQTISGRKKKLSLVFFAQSFNRVALDQLSFKIPVPLKMNTFSPSFVVESSDRVRILLTSSILTQADKLKEIADVINSDHKSYSKLYM